jgi:putative phosphoserine phosphatase/1-acylglycerol-3-phosphate O-acyltransferase
MLHAQLTREIRSGPSGPKVAAFFDVDRTLLAGFSGLAFFRERLLSGRMAPRELAAAAAGGLGYAVGRTGFSGLVTATTATYRGLSETVLEELGQEVFEKHLATEIYPESRALLKAHQDMGHTVAIVSSATPYQVDPLARDLGVEHVLCTHLEVKRGVFTGNVVRPTCFREGKVAAASGFSDAHDVDLSSSYFYTDSSDDLPLLEAVRRPRPLNPDRRLAQVARERGWLTRNFHSRGTPGAGDVMRSALVYGSIFPSVLAGLSVGAVNQSRRDAINVAASMWGDLATALSGVHLLVEGEENLWSKRPAVFIFNHQSAIDAPLMVKLLRRDFTGIGKQEIRWNPIFGPIFAAAGIVFIDRANSASAIEAMRPAVEALDQGLSVVIAPEGTRTPTPRLKRFKKGAFHLAMQAGVPIVPVIFRNALDALPKNALVMRPASIEAVVLPPVDTSAWTTEGLDAEIAAVRERFVEVLEG